MKQSAPSTTRDGPDECSSTNSIGSENLIMVSMKDALQSMNEKKQLTGVKQYENMVQKLESDVRGHFKVSIASVTLAVRTRNENSHGLPRRQDRVAASWY